MDRQQINQALMSAVAEVLDDEVVIERASHQGEAWRTYEFLLSSKDEHIRALAQLHKPNEDEFPVCTTCIMVSDDEDDEDEFVFEHPYYPCDTAELLDQVATALSRREARGGA